MSDELKRGDAPTTAITNAMAEEKGFPAETAEGEIVLIVEKVSQANGSQRLTASDGRVFRPAKPGETFGIQPYYDLDSKDDEAVVEEPGAPAPYVGADPEQEPVGDTPEAPLAPEPPAAA